MSVELIGTVCVQHALNREVDIEGQAVVIVAESGQRVNRDATLRSPGIPCTRVLLPAETVAPGGAIHRDICTSPPRC